MNSPSARLITKPSASSPTSVMDVGNTATARREIAIFWDFENVPLPSSVMPGDASKAIVNAVSPYGRIVDRRLYFDMTRPEGAGNWSALDSSGFDLVNTPRRNQKETLDKKLIADVLTFAWDSAVRNDNCKPCVVLLTSDGDYAYALSKLADRGVMTVVMYGKDHTVAKVLKSSADITLSFEKDVLSTINQQPQTPIRKGIRSSSPIMLHTLEDDARLLCRVIVAEIANGTKPHEQEGWLLGSQGSVAFRKGLLQHDPNAANATSDALKERYRKARKCAIDNKWLIFGRTRMAGSFEGQICEFVTGQDNPKEYSLLDYLRVSFEGKLELESGNSKNKQVTSGNETAVVVRHPKATSCQWGTKLFIKNIPASLRINDIVKCLEQGTNVIVIKGNTLKGPPFAPFIFARVQVETPEQASRLIQLGREGKLDMNGRTWDIKQDLETKVYSIDPEFCYVRASASPVDDVRILCNVILQYIRTSRVGDTEERQGQGWMDGGQAAEDFKLEVRKQQILADPSLTKERFKQARAKAISRNLIEVGKRIKEQQICGALQNKIEVTGPHPSSDRYTGEIYVRVTEAGAQYAEKATSEHASALVFIKNLPEGTTIKNLVEFLETNHDCMVQRAYVEVSSKPVLSKTNAHIEFSSTQDAAKILKLGSKYNGLLFQGQALVAVPDERAPFCFRGTDPELFYESSIPATVTTSTMDSASMCTEEVPSSETHSHKSVPESQQNQGKTRDEESLVSNDVFLFCKVMYEQSGLTMDDDIGDDEHIAKHTKWLQSGVAGLQLQRLFKDSPEERKARFKQARDTAIDTGLAEMGRCNLKTSNKEIIVVPRYRSGKQGASLSLHTYLRLTVKGLNYASRTADQNAEVATTASPRMLLSKNLYLSNLPKTSKIVDVVARLEHAYGIVIQRACLNGASHLKANISCHVEISSDDDVQKICKVDKGRGLVFGGRPLKLRPDRYVPDWSKWASHLKYEREEKTIEVEDTKTEEADIDINGAEASEEEEKETFETTNLLYGDNLALLYAQGAPTKRNSDSLLPNGGSLGLGAIPNTNHVENVEVHEETRDILMIAHESPTKALDSESEVTEPVASLTSSEEMQRDELSLLPPDLLWD